MSGSVSSDRENELESELNKGALWAITYGDLMSYLMIFFMVLFSLYVNKAASGRPLETSAQLADLQKVFGGKIDPALLDRITNFKQEEAVAYKLKESKEVQALSEFVQIQTGDEFIRLVLPESISFEPGQAILGAQAESLMGILAGIVKDIPNDIVVEGHTDDRPIHTRAYPNNFFLSSARAYSVMESLEREGVPRDRISGQGYADVRPVSANDTVEGRAKNRRVEIVLVRRR
jgi:chemotaxis protein MotB